METYNRIIKKNYVITLENDIIRQEKVKDQFKKIDVEFTFSKSLPYSTYIMSKDEINNLSEYDRCFYGRAGCNHSHYTVLKSIIEDVTIKDDDYVSVFEDDVIFPDKETFHKAFNTIQSLLKNVSIIYLGCFCCDNSDVGEAINSNIIKINHDSIFCAHAIIYKKSIIKDIVKNYRENLLKYFIIPAHLRQPRPGPTPTFVEMYDTFLPIYLIKNNISIYSFYPPLTVQENITGSYNFPGRQGNINCRISIKILEKIKDYEKLKNYNDIWPILQ